MRPNDAVRGILAAQRHLRETMRQQLLEARGSKPLPYLPIYGAIVDLIQKRI